jgi:hypothetical protein
MAEIRDRPLSGGRSVAVAACRLAVLLVSSALAVGCTPPSASAPASAVTTDEPTSGAFEGVGAGPLGADGSLTPDGQRLFDIVALQGALTRYLAAHGSYPQSLEELVGAFTPSLPLDPATGEPYSYQPTPDRQAYSLEARLSNGRTFSGVPHEDG